MGPGRGVGLMFIGLGLLMLLAVGVASLSPRLRQLETEIPDAVAPTADLPAAALSGPSLREA